MSKIDNKISVLTRIRESKDILFGQFSDTLTKEKKVEEWKKICEFCKALGLIPQEKEYTYVRDVFWSNIKRTTLAKKDNANQSGSAGGKIKKITSIDEIVIEIIGKDSPILEGIGVQDKMENNATTAEKSVTPNHNADIEDATKRSHVNTSHKKLKRFVTKNSTSHEDYKEEITNKKRKLELQLEFLTLQNYKMKLEIFEMEQRLNISHSDFTSGIVSEQDGMQSIYISSDTSDNKNNNT